MLLAVNARLPLHSLMEQNFERGRGSGKLSRWFSSISHRFHGTVPAKQTRKHFVLIYSMCTDSSEKDGFSFLLIPFNYNMSKKVGLIFSADKTFFAFFILLYKIANRKHRFSPCYLYICTLKTGLTA